jgi:exodeoxyribonuclease V alpha subunit
MVNFASLLADNAAKRDKLAKKPAHQTQKQKLDKLLHGSGVTKRMGVQAEKTHEQILQDAASISDAEKDQLLKQPAVIDLDVKDLPSTMMDDAIQLDESQQAAVDGLKKEKYGCLIGAAGTGKTTTVKRLISSLESTTPTIDINLARTANAKATHEELNVAICFCSFTGRAVQQLKRAIPATYHPMCQTIHATLGYMPTTEEFFDKEADEWKEKRVFRPSFTATNKLPYKICIVDEAGMVPIPLWDELVAALPDDARIILIGDINQLPPVQGRSVLGFAMTAWPTYTLEKIHRQAADNPIIANAHRILHGKMPINDKKNFVIKTVGDGSLGAMNDAIAVLQHLDQAGKFDAIQDAFIVPQNKGTIGQVHFNEKLVTYFNKPQKTAEGLRLNPRHVITAGFSHLMLAVGDKVMLLQNDRQRGLTNGMIGVVHSIETNAAFRGQQIADDATMKFTGDIDLGDLHEQIKDVQIDTDEEDSERQASHVTKIKFQNVKDEVTFATSGDYGRITHAYAFTCHKSQGGEYPTVVILAHSANLKMLTREWLYTAITRAQERVILLCNRRGLIHAVNNQRIKGRTVAEKAAAFIALQDKTDTKVPNLPPPEKVANKPFEGVK